jgi:transcriptional regulator with XRE-family HTH domain
LRDDVPQDDDILRAIGGRLREARLATGLTGQQIAAKFGCSSNWVYNMEGGVQNFTYSMFRRYIDFLKLDFRQVLVGATEAEDAAGQRRLRAIAREVSEKLTGMSRDISALNRVVGDLRTLNDESTSLLEERERKEKP